MANEVKIPIQLPTYKYDGLKANAISAITEYINNHTNEFVDREQINIRYINEFQEDCITGAVVISGDNGWYLSVGVNDIETLKIVDTESEPEDTSVLWLSDYEYDSGETDDVRTEVNALKNELAELKEMLLKHDYALSSTLAGGDIVTNSEKYDEENKNEPEKPENAIETGDYATEDLNIASFDLYIGNTPLTYYSNSIALWMGTKYYLKLRAFNAEGEEIKDLSNTELEVRGESSVVIFEDVSGKTIMIGIATGTSAYVTAKLTDESGNTFNKSYYLFFEYSEKPDYETYSEPNVHHLLIKKADTYDILTANTDYLCINEFVWCIENNTLYLKAKAGNGTIQLFKINGTGSTPVTGETITYDVTPDGTFTAESSDGSVNVDEELYLTLVGTVDENGILILNDSES